MPKPEIVTVRYGTRDLPLTGILIALKRDFYSRARFSGELILKDIFAFRPVPIARDRGTVNLRNIPHEFVATRRYGHRHGLEDRVVEHRFVFVAISLEDAGKLLERFLRVLVDLFEFLRDI